VKTSEKSISEKFFLLASEPGGFKLKISTILNPFQNRKKGKVTGAWRFLCGPDPESAFMMKTRI
jgi:hypothetical protein